MAYQKSIFDIQQMRRAGQATAAIVEALGQMVAVEVSAATLETRARELCQEYGVEPAFLGFEGYEYATCISVNDEVLHAIPYAKKVLAQGDLVKIDFGVRYRGYYADHCRTFVAGAPRSAEDERLLAVGKAATMNAVALVRTGEHMGTVSHAMEATAQEAGFTVVRRYVGHGIGKRLHEPPEVPSFGKLGTGITLETNMVFCVECQVCAGSGTVIQDADGWTVRTRDHSRSVMFEHMVRVTPEGPEILTDLVS